MAVKVALQAIFVVCFLLGLLLPPVHGCGQGAQADIIFVMDESGSVSYNSFQQMKTFVKNLVGGLTISSTEIRVGLMKYASGTTREFDLNRYYDRNQMMTHIGNLGYQPSGTNTGAAIQFARTQMFTSSKGDRSGVSNILVVITDGRSYGSPTVAQAGRDMRNTGATVFAVGIGAGIPLGELNEMATDPDSDHVFAVSGFSALAAIQSKFTQSVCPPNPCESTLTLTNHYNYKEVTWPAHIPVNSINRVYFEVKCCNDAHFVLCKDPAGINTGTNMYEIVIGGWGNSQSVIRTAKQGTHHDTVKHTTPVNCNQFKRFYVKWAGHYIEVGKDIPDPANPGKYKEDAPFLSWQNPNSFAVEHVFVSAWANAQAIWKFDFCQRPTNGGWGAWGGWGGCTKTCGSGAKTRTRACDNPTASHGGAACSGGNSQSTTCNTNGCPVNGNWGGWGSYGSCSKTCASGTKSRSRSCNSPAPAHGGSQCSGSGSSSTSCNTHHCPVNGNWGGWGSYGSCSVNCGGGSKSRSRSCNSPSPAHGGSNCAGSGSSSASCNTHSCSVNGNWGNWGGWGSCSKSCASGSKTRTRACNNPAPAHGGSQCPGSGSDSTSCNTHHCPVHGNWGSWTNWGGCTLTCGTGSKSRSRQCNNPAPLHGGNQCSGSGSSTANCNTHPCPIDGKFTSWSAWGTCSTTCALGSWSRSRSCTNPSPQHGGAACSGATGQTTSCNLRPCPIDGAWSLWQQWSACSVTCMGIGTRSRTRDCDNPTPMYGGAQCPGAGTGSETCDKSLTLCSVASPFQISVYSTTPGNPVAGGWGTWEAWSTCTKSCQSGIRIHKRSCNSPVPKFGGSPCTGQTWEKEFCNNVACPGGSGYIQTCPERYFDCKDGNITCIHYLEKCDCSNHCEDGSDEDAEWAGCSAGGEGACSNRARLVAPESVLLGCLLGILVVFNRLLSLITI